MRIAIVDYDAGNLTSVARALQHLGCDDPRITADGDAIRQADRVIFPGVGTAGSGMRAVRARGIDQALRDVVQAGTPLLGICFGMQLLFEHSDEDGGVDCLGLLPGTVRRFSLDDPGLKVPHMGWNPVRFTADDPLIVGVSPGASFYFVHSYYCAPSDPSLVLATTDHGHDFCAGVRRDNLVAVQFHPEKSGPAGLRLLANFVGVST